MRHLKALAVGAGAAGAALAVSNVSWVQQQSQAVQWGVTLGAGGVTGAILNAILFHIKA
jgi:hypothetical protein